MTKKSEKNNNDRKDVGKEQKENQKILEHCLNSDLKDRKNMKNTIIMNIRQKCLDSKNTNNNLSKDRKKMNRKLKRN